MKWKNNAKTEIWIDGECVQTSYFFIWYCVYNYLVWLVFGRRCLQTWKMWFVRFGHPVSLRRTVAPSDHSVTQCINHLFYSFAMANGSAFHSGLSGYWREIGGCSSWKWRRSTFSTQPRFYENKISGLPAVVYATTNPYSNYCPCVLGPTKRKVFTEKW